jgi:hypothetical protein
MQLQQVETVESKSAQAHLGFLTQVLRPAERNPLVGAWAHLTCRGSDEEVVGIGVERLVDEFFNVRSAGIGRVDEGHGEHRRFERCHSPKPVPPSWS